MGGEGKWCRSTCKSSFLCLVSSFIDKYPQSAENSYETKLFFIVVRSNV